MEIAQIGNNKIIANKKKKKNKKKGNCKIEKKLGKSLIFKSYMLNS
jgi:hypothetical protein